MKNFVLICMCVFLSFIIGRATVRKKISIEKCTCNKRSIEAQERQAVALEFMVATIKSQWPADSPGIENLRKGDR